MLLLQVDCKCTGPTGPERDKALEVPAHSITGEPGFVWRIWTESPERQRLVASICPAHGPTRKPIPPCTASGSWRSPASANVRYRTAPFIYGRSYICGRM